MPPTPIVYVHISFFAHATEDIKKVVEAVQNVLPDKYAHEIDFKSKSLKGYYGNPIILFETKIEDREIIKAVMENFSLGFGEVDKETIIKEINLRVEKGSLYIRLNKQIALQGKVKLGAANPIRIKVRFKKGTLKKIINVCREFGMLP